MILISALDFLLNMDTTFVSFFLLFLPFAQLLLVERCITVIITINSEKELLWIISARKIAEWKRE